MIFKKWIEENRIEVLIPQYSTEYQVKVKGIFGYGLSLDDALTDCWINSNYGENE